MTDQPSNRCEHCPALLTDAERTMGRMCARCLRREHTDAQTATDTRPCTCARVNACAVHDAEIDQALAELEAVERFRASVRISVRRG